MDNESRTTGGGELMFTEKKTLNQWMSELGFKWIEGKEEFMKHEVTFAGASEVIHQLIDEGKVTSRG